LLNILAAILKKWLLRPLEQSLTRGRYATLHNTESELVSGALALVEIALGAKYVVAKYLNLVIMCAKFGAFITKCPIKTDVHRIYP
jgi:hypothetical protein